MMLEDEHPPASARDREAPTTVCLLFSISSEAFLIFLSQSQPLEMCCVDIGEESYFNGDDGDDDEGVAPGPHPAPNTLLPTLISPPLSQFQSLPRRKR